MTPEQFIVLAGAKLYKEHYDEGYKYAPHHGDSMQIKVLTPELLYTPKENTKEPAEEWEYTPARVSVTTHKTSKEYPHLLRTPSNLTTHLLKAGNTYS